MKCCATLSCALLLALGGCSAHCGEFKTQAAPHENEIPDLVPLYHVTTFRSLAEKPGRASGGGRTGFVVGRSLGLTADHNMSAETRVYFRDAQVKVLDRGAAAEPGDDWLLVSLPDDFSDKPVELGPPGPPPPGSILTVLGYPSCESEPDEVHDTVSLIAHHESCPEEHFTCRVIADTRVAAAMTRDVATVVLVVLSPGSPSRAGFSGAPVFHEGEVIGLWIGSTTFCPYPFADTFLERWFTREYGLIRLIPDRVRQLCEERE